jgi:enamine deaminase RidA (YjgF/YER057c/UK114 family)
MIHCEEGSLEVRSVLLFSDDQYDERRLRHANPLSQPPTLCPTFGWTHVVTAIGGKTIYVSGQVSVNERGEVVGKGDLRAQTIQTFDNLQHALAAAGATFRDVVKSNLYVVGLKPEHVPIIREVRGRYFSAEHPPASTLVGVEKLVGPDWLIEIEVVAVV